MEREDQESTPTIVGGQPFGKRDSGAVIPHGLEAVVLLAAAEPGFREAFAQDRKKALSDAGISLSEAEWEILASISNDDLMAMARCAAAGPRTGTRRLAATAVSLAALASLTTMTPNRAAAETDEYSRCPALGQLESSGVSQETTTPTPTEPIRGIVTDTPTLPPVMGIQPDTPTPTPKPQAQPHFSLTGPTETPESLPTATPTPSPSPAATHTNTPPPTATLTLTPAGIRPSDTPTQPAPAGIRPTDTPPIDGISPDLPQQDASLTNLLDEVLAALRSWYGGRPR